VMPVPSLPGDPIPLSDGPLARGGLRQLPIDDHHAPIYTVGQVSEMLRVQPAFLRRLDAEAVVQPARSGGGQRRYSRSDIDRVERVSALSGEGLTLAGIRRLLALEAQVSDLQEQLAEERRRRS
jgi:MerR family transcriptional regulator/heat shock protein HspR